MPLYRVAPHCSQITSWGIISHLLDAKYNRRIIFIVSPSNDWIGSIHRLSVPKSYLKRGNTKDLL